MCMVFSVKCKLLRKNINMTGQITKTLITKSWCKEDYLICSLVCPWIKSFLDEGSLIWIYRLFEIFLPD